MPKAMPLLKHDSVSTNSDSATSAYSKETLSISTHSLSIQSSNIALSAVQDADDDCIIISNEDDDSKETKLSEEAMIDSPTKTISQVNYQLCNKSPKKQSQRMLVLFGCAGSGKSTLSSLIMNHDKDHQWVRISQDQLGSKEKCIRAARYKLRAGKNVIIDRTNLTIQQNSVRPEAVVMQTSPSECLERLQTRINHEGGLSPKISVEVVNRQLQQDAYELPSRIEGFCKLYPCYSTLACAKEVIEGIKTLIQKSSVNSEFPKEMRLRENQQQEYHNAFSSLEIKVADHSGAAKSYKLNDVSEKHGQSSHRFIPTKSINKWSQESKKKRDESVRPIAAKTKLFGADAKRANQETLTQSKKLIDLNKSVYGCTLINTSIARNEKSPQVPPHSTEIDSCDNAQTSHLYANSAVKIPLSQNIAELVLWLIPPSDSCLHDDLLEARKNIRKHFGNVHLRDSDPIYSAITGFFFCDVVDVPKILNSISNEVNKLQSKEGTMSASVERWIVTESFVGLKVNFPAENLLSSCLKSKIEANFKYRGRKVRVRQKTFSYIPVAHDLSTSTKETVTYYLTKFSSLRLPIAFSPSLGIFRRNEHTSTKTSSENMICLKTWDL